MSESVRARVIRQSSLGRRAPRASRPRAALERSSASLSFPDREPSIGVVVLASPRTHHANGRSREVLVLALRLQPRRGRGERGAARHRARHRRRRRLESDAARARRRRPPSRGRSPRSVAALDFRAESDFRANSQQCWPNTTSFCEKNLARRRDRTPRTPSRRRRTPDRRRRAPPHAFTSTTTAAPTRRRRAAAAPRSSPAPSARDALGTPSDSSRRDATTTTTTTTTTRARDDRASVTPNSRARSVDARCRSR